MQNAAPTGIGTIFCTDCVCLLHAFFRAAGQPDSFFSGQVCRIGICYLIHFGAAAGKDLVGKGGVIGMGIREQVHAGNRQVIADAHFGEGVIQTAVCIDCRRVGVRRSKLHP